MNNEDIGTTLFYLFLHFYFLATVKFADVWEDRKLFVFVLWKSKFYTLNSGLKWKLFHLIYRRRSSSDVTSLVLGTSTARSKICPLKDCSKKISLGFCSARYVLEKSCNRACPARFSYARNALGMEHKKSIILDEFFIVCSEYFFKIVPCHSCSTLTILSTISQNIFVLFLLKVLPRVENKHLEGTKQNIIWIDIEYLVFFAATRHVAFLIDFTKFLV